MSDSSGRNSGDDDTVMPGDEAPPYMRGLGALEAHEDVAMYEEEDEDSEQFDPDDDDDDDDISESSSVTFDSQKRSSPPPESEESAPVLEADAVPAEPTPLEMTMMVVEYLLIEGYREAARALCEEANVVLTEEDWESVDARVDIRKDIMEGKISEAVEKVKAIAPQILDLSEIRFNLYQQRFIELLRVSDIEGALLWAQDNLSNDEEMTADQIRRLERTCTLAAFEHPETSRFADLLQQEHRTMVANSVNQAILRHLDKPDTTRIENLFKIKVFMSMNLPECIDRGVQGELVQAERLYNSL